MRTQLTIARANIFRQLLAATLGLALAFTFSCHDGGGNEDGTSSSDTKISSSGNTGGKQSSSSEITVNPSSSGRSSSGGAISSSSSGTVSSSSEKSSSSEVTLSCNGSLYNPLTHYCYEQTTVKPYGTLTDSRDNQTYKTVKIGIQTWMAENLNYKTRGECYDKTPANCEYGRLYKWEDAMQVCPDGWHLSTKAEWAALISAVGKDAGKKLKASSYWKDGAGVDSYGFGALPGGALNDEFKGINIEGSWWTSTEYNEGRSYVKWIDARNEVYESTTTNWGLKTNSFSVRCVKNYSSSDYTNSNIEYGSVADNSGKTYNTVKIGEQTWMAENLNYDVPGNETDICYDNDNNNCPLYGKMYNWATAMVLPSKCNNILSTNDDDCVIKTPHQGICPSGWHIPSNEDWDKLMRYVDGDRGTSSPYESKTASKYLKAKEGWHDCGPSNSGKTYLCEDTYGFSILPSGSGDSNNSFHNVIYYGYWWNSSEKSSGLAYHRCVDNDKDIFYYHDDDLYHSGKFGLFSVRCVKD